MLDDHTPDRPEKLVRFGCGLAFGGVLGFFLALRVLSDKAGVVAVVAVVALTCAVLALRHGDRFWHSLRDWLNW